MRQETLRTLEFSQLRDPDGPGAQFMRIAEHGQTPAHDHVFHEVVYVESGSALHETVEGVAPIEAGDLIVIRPQVWHGYLKPRQLNIVNCLIDNQLMQRLSGVLTTTEGAFDLYQRRVPRPGQQPPVVLRVSAGETSRLSSRFDAMFQEQQARASGWQAIIRAGVLELLVLAARLYRARQGQSRGPLQARRSEQAVLDVVAYLEAHYSQPIDLTAMAQRVNLSSAHLSRSFTRRMGMGLVNFIHRLRVEEACRLLRWTQQPVAEVAAQVGYDEIAYFSRCFRKHMGQSPTQYRSAGNPSAMVRR